MRMRACAARSRCPRAAFAGSRIAVVARPVAKSLNSAVDGLRTWLDGSATAEYDRARTYVLGFSAGMITAGALLLADPVRFAGAVLLSGAIATDLGSATPGRLAGMPIFNGHGSADMMIPHGLVTQTLHYLRDASGAVLTERTYPHAHSISHREIADIAAWFAEEH